MPGSRTVESRLARDALRLHRQAGLVGISTDGARILVGRLGAVDAVVSRRTQDGVGDVVVSSAKVASGARFARSLSL